MQKFHISDIFSGKSIHFRKVRHFHEIFSRFRFHYNAITVAIKFWNFITECEFGA